MNTVTLFAKEIQETEDLVAALTTLRLRADRLKLLQAHTRVSNFLLTQKRLKSLIVKLKIEDQETILTLIALGQGSALFPGWDRLEDPFFALEHLAQSLKPLQKNYQAIGGLAGYQLVIFKLLQRKSTPPSAQTLHPPIGTPIDYDTEEVNALVRAGIENLVEFGEVYPVGGAADRLSLQDDLTGEPLPQAKLQFAGRSLLEGLIRDLEGRERLYQNITGEKILTPVAMMTSPEKNNHRHILDILEEKNWFNRPKEFFYLFEQPLVPMVSDTGKFAVKNPLELSMKPGGHGIIWQLMQTNGVFNWFQSLKRDKLIIRQINNPIAGIDKNLLTLAGKGARDKKAFGFLSCPRLVGAAEGMNVTVVKHNEDGYLSTITNVEYTDFNERGLKDEPEAEGSPFSHYPANTNILFANLKEIKKALKRLPLPGMLINLKGDVQTLTKEGKLATHKGGRLETTMQNIADVMGDFSMQPLDDLSQLKTFILYNSREKTLSVTKNQWKPGSSLEGTPQGAWLDQQRNYRELFTKHLDISLPEITSESEPSFVIDYHPSLGPLWEIIRQKIQKGSLKPGSELILEISELKWENLELDGSLHILSNNLNGRVFLKNVIINNSGINKLSKNIFWNGTINRNELVTINLLGESEFHAEDILLEGSHTFEVPDGYRMILTSSKGKIKTVLEKLTTSTWNWDYRLTKEGSVLLTFNSKSSTFSA